MKRQIIIFCMPLLILHQEVKAQDLNTLKDSVIRSDADIRSGNYRDVLTNFFQLAFNDLTGPDKRLRFSSNLFALRLKVNPTLNIDSFYKKNTFWRNSNVDFDLKLQEGYNFNGAAFGYKYALVNRRDYTIAKNFPVIIAIALNDYSLMLDTIEASISAEISDPIQLGVIVTELNSFTRDTTIKFADLSPKLKGIIQNSYGNKTKIEDSWNFRESVFQIYNDVKDSYKNKLLWTVSANTSTYTDGLLFSDFDLTSRATAGLVKTGSNSSIEFDIKGQYSLIDDTLKANKDLNRNVLSFDAGLNWVFRDHKNDKPVFEFKAASAYNTILNGLYLNERKETFTLNGILRFRFSNNFWIPLEFKYDPKEANVFGFLSVKLNFD